MADDELRIYTFTYENERKARKAQEAAEARDYLVKSAPNLGEIHLYVRGEQPESLDPIMRELGGSVRG